MCYLDFFFSTDSREGNRLSGTGVDESVKIIEYHRTHVMSLLKYFKTINTC